MKEFRRKYMEEVRGVVSRQVLNIEQIHKRKTSINPKLASASIFSALKRRAEVLSVRSSYIKALYEIQRANTPSKEFVTIPEEAISKIAFTADLAMAIIYKENHYYDGKYDWKDDQQGKCQMIGTFLLKDYLYEYIDHDTDLKPYSWIIRNRLRQIFLDVEAGQFLDQQFNFRSYTDCAVHDESIENILAENFSGICHVLNDVKNNESRKTQVATDVYFARIYLISSSLFRHYTELLSEITNTNKTAASQMLQFADIYGLLMQIVNDNADFVLDEDTSNKKGYDVLSDLRNETLSLPIILHLAQIEKSNYNKRKYNTDIIYSFYQMRLGKLEQGEISLRGMHNEILAEIINSQAITSSMKIGAKLKKKCIEAIDGLKNAEYFFDAVEIASYNRYYHHIVHAKKALKAGRKYYCEAHSSRNNTVSHSRCRTIPCRTTAKEVFHTQKEVAKTI